MRKMMLFFLFACTSIFVSAQDSLHSVPKNAVFIEVGGNAVDLPLTDFISINYDRLLFVRPNVRISFRVGTSIPIQLASSSHYTNLHAFPVMLNLLLGKRRFFFEAGTGFELLYFDANYKVVYSAFTGVLGIRYQNYKKGIMARVGITPSFSVVKTEIYLGAPVGASVGYSF